jgi:hypothetical protein
MITIHFGNKHKYFLKNTIKTDMNRLKTRGKRLDPQQGWTKGAFSGIFGELSSGNNSVSI